MRDRFTAAARRAAALSVAVAAAIGAAIGAAARPASAATGPQVQQAIDRGEAFLFAHQVNGNWELIPKPDPEVTEPFEVHNAQWGGPTAIATLALLSAGVDASDPRMKRAIDFLRHADLKGNYAIGLRAQVWGLLPQQDPANRQAGLPDLTKLLRGIITRGPGQGCYGYLSAPPATGNGNAGAAEWDHSVSQFAVLGTWSLAQQGLEVPTSYWQSVDAAWHAHQQRDGSWFYSVNPDGSAHHTTDLSMTAAGVATLFITQEFTQIAPRCNGNLSDPGIAAGLRYVGDHLNELTDDRRYYVLFGLSRIGLASGYKYLGKTDWFEWGADQLVKRQGGDGSWRNAHVSEAVDGVADTAFGLLFLSRGRLPVMVNKLEYDVAPAGKGAKPTPATWNQRPRDVANLSRWVGRQLESPLNWQVVNLHASSDDLHDAPLLYMAGGKAPKLSPADVDKLRAYVEDGGLLVGHADCASPDFAKGFVALGEQMFPGRKFRPLEATHPIYVDQTFPRSKWKGKVSLDGLTNGARELMVLLPPTDPAKVWQGQTFQSVKSDTMGQLMIDLLLYAVDKEGLRRRGETYVVDRKPGPGSKPVNVARVKYAGNFNPEPGGWRRLSNVLHNDRVADLTVTVVDPAAGGKLDPKQFPLAVLTVADVDVQLGDAVRSAVRNYVNGGGTLLVDAAGGRSAYRSAAEAEIAKMFPAAPHELPVLPPNDPVLSGPKLAVKTVDYRRYERSGRMAHDPRLRGYAIGGRTAVLYSPEDVSVGLVGQPIDGVAGYTPADATKVVTAVVAYAAKLR